jgi:hypothetical protein
VNSKLSAEERYLRDQAILAMSDAGHKLKIIGATHELTLGRVTQIIRKERERRDARAVIP